LRPDARVLISSRLSGFGATRTSTKPTIITQRLMCYAGAAPATQPQSSAGSDEDEDGKTNRIDLADHPG
jgi:hypothetical protein